jgi:hypothetical protein
VASSKSHGERDDHGNDRKSKSMRRRHYSLDKSTIRAHASSRLGRIPSVSLVRRQRRRPESNIFQGELRKIKPPNFNGEDRKGEETKV